MINVSPIRTGLFSAVIASGLIVACSGKEPLNQNPLIGKWSSPERPELTEFITDTYSVSNDQLVIQRICRTNTASVTASVTVASAILADHLEVKESKRDTQTLAADP